MSQPSDNPYPHQPQQPYGEQPVSQQPGGEQPPTAGQSWGDPAAAPAPPAPKKSRAGRIVLIVLAVVLVLCLGGAVITWFAVKDEVGEVVDATNTRVVTPTTLAGRPQVNDPELKKLSDETIAEMRSTVQNETGTVGAFYGDPAKKDLVMVVAASGVMADPKKELDDALAGIKTQLAVTEVTTVEPGPLGGEARCGGGNVAGTAVGACLWADRGSVGMIVMYFKTAAQAQAEFVTMRGQIEQRS
ncbi:hypothetical protein [Micromonospora sp. RTGN7]|uniref:hypothetical protein n=1 Tax=Micromonospora sp. RTGN7 TaxID=3016526 RepID=UPI0029FF15D4|nr:hypothetical protein [Micromonospora sp. RTGN7]